MKAKLTFLTIILSSLFFVACDDNNDSKRDNYTDEEYTTVGYTTK